MAVGAKEMGRPKKTDPPKDRSDRETVIHLKGSPEYVDWLEDAHRKTHIAKATLVRLGLIEVARIHKLPTPPEI